MSLIEFVTYQDECSYVKYVFMTIFGENVDYTSLRTL